MRSPYNHLLFVRISPCSGVFMKRFSPLFLLFLITGPALANPEAGLVAVRDLGAVNGQALACSQMAISGQAKALMIKHAPKTRRYGELFEEATNTAFLTQGKDQDRCPSSAELSEKLAELAGRLQAALPAAASPQ